MIRAYGPGKFDKVIDSYVYALSLDGCGEEAGDVQTTNHFCTVHLGREGAKAILDEAAREGDALTPEESRLVRSHFGAIIEENDQGFVTVSYFKTKAALDKKWQTIEVAVSDSEDAS